MQYWQYAQDTKMMHKAVLR